MIPDLKKKLERQLRIFRKRTSVSRDAHARSGRIIPGGVAGNEYFVDPYPLRIDSALGAMIRDADGNSYIDCNNAYGTLILGHGNRKVVQAISEAIETLGTTVSPGPNQLELQYAMQLSDIIRSAEMVRFTATGTMANQLAIRLCLAYGKAGKVGKFEGQFHGSFSYGLISSRTPRGEWGPSYAPYPYPCSKDVGEHELYSTVVMPFNRLEETIALIKKHRRELSCVIMEAVSGGYRAASKDFIKGVRETTEKYDIPLILDETTTGFRVSLGGAQERYRITPDLTTLGKILGGGLPLGAVVGRRDIMELLIPSKGEKGVFHSETSSGNVLSLAAGLATVNQLKREGTYVYLEKIAQTIKKEIEGLSQTYNLHIQPLSFTSIINTVFTGGKILNYRDMFKEDAAAHYLFDLMLLNNGIFVVPGQPWYLCTAMTKPDMQRTAEVIEAIFDYMSQPL
jgi:glutamate-1-semialdehyde 2,1-aminomutase